ncbi:MAG TPA: peptidoglycan-associated lipoprotein Pal [Vicinamibacterales bacterium]
MRYRHILLMAVAVATTVAMSACAKRQSAPVTQPQPAPPVTEPAAVPPAPPAPRGSQSVVDNQVTSGPILEDDALSGRTLEDLNRDSPLQPVFFPVDSAELDDEARKAVAANAEVLRQNQQWAVTIEGHCDERGTAEYNLALGERRATAARTYLVSLGIAAARLKTASYGDEYPFDRAHSEEAWSKNRRAHFVISGK